MFSFQKLQVWQQGHQLTLAVYRLTRNFPKEELFGLTSQMRRAAASIPHNIAEGCGRNSDAELLRFVTIASGSSTELESQLLLARDLGYAEAAEAKQLIEQVVEVRKMLWGFRQAVAKRTDKTGTER